MDLQGIKDRAAEILAAAADQGAISGILTDIVDGFTIMTAENIQLQQALNQANNENENLRRANMDLFLKIPVGSEPAKVPETIEPEQPTFESLFADGKLI